jgi:hypothetical protein
MDKLQTLSSSGIINLYSRVCSLLVLQNAAEFLGHVVINVITCTGEWPSQSVPFCLRIVGIAVYCCA